MQPPPLPSELAKTRKFKPPVDAATTPFLRVDDATVQFERSCAYERIELELSDDQLPQVVDLDLSKIAPIDDTLPFSLESVPVERASAPYELIELRLSLPAVAEPLVTVQPPPALRRNHATIILITIAVMICAFGAGVGAAFVL